MPRYVPPAFTLVEICDAPDAEVGLRSLTHWNGPIGSPPQEVILGWVEGDRAAYVSSAMLGGDEGTAERMVEAIRRNAALLMTLDGDLAQGSIESPREVHTLVDEIATSTNDWTESRITCQGRDAPAWLRRISPTEVLGHFEGPGVQVGFLTRGVPQELLKFRRLTPSAAGTYDSDPLRSASA